MQDWKHFFSAIGEYFMGKDLSKNLPVQEAKDYWYHARTSSIRHFCTPSQVREIILQRHIYIQEGPRAFHKSEAMKLAVQSSAQHYFIFKIRYDEYEKYKLLKRAAGDFSEKNKLAEDVHDHLLRQALLSAHSHLREQVMQISPILNGKNTQAAVEKYLEAKAAWELKNPGKVYEEEYICPETVYARYAKSPHSGVVMPTFSNTVGFVNVFKHPLIALGYGINGLRKIFFDYPAQFICWCVKKLTFGNKVLRLFFSFILAGPFELLNILFFGLAKISVGDNFKDSNNLLLIKSPLLQEKVKTKTPKKSGKIAHFKKTASHFPHRTSRHK